MTTDEFRKMAMAMGDVTEAPHHEITSFRTKKRIFATLDSRRNRGCLMLSPELQSVYCLMPDGSFVPVDNAWGKSGSTWVDLKTVKKAVLKEAMKAAYERG